MTKRMLIDATHAEETRVVVLDGTRLEDFDVETSAKRHLKGNIYLAKVVRVEPSLQAAFVEYGGNRHGFLAFSEIHPDYYQIPVADRQRLLELEAEEARREEEEDDLELALSEASPPPQPPQVAVPARAGRGRGRDRRDSRRGPASTSFDTETAIAQVLQAEALQAEAWALPGNPRLLLAADSDQARDAGAEARMPASEAWAMAGTPALTAAASASAGAALPTASSGTADPTSEAAADVVARSASVGVSAWASPAEPALVRRMDGAASVADEADRAEAEPWARSAMPALFAADGMSDDQPGPDYAATYAEPAYVGDPDSSYPEGDDDSNGNEAREDDEPAPETLGGDPDSVDEPGERRLPSRFLRSYKIQEVIHRRQIMLVQVVKEERGTKGAALTTYLSLAGRFSVLMPNSPRGGGISRKITSATDRRRLKEVMTELDIPRGMGLIIRTAGAARPKPEIKRDCEYLLRLWDDIRDHTMKSIAPAMIYEEASLIKRTIRDVYARDIDEIQVDGVEGWRAAHEFMRMLMPTHARKVQLWRDQSQPLFARYQVEAQLDAMLVPTVQLRSGGYLVINQAEALVAIDVNSGRSTRERNIEETALRTNLEAADEVARQLRLRDLAGLIVIDFIDMESRRHNAMVERRLKDALRNDRARIQIGTISHFGLLEMSRQRLRPSLAETSFITCPHCNGTGQVRSTESAGIYVLRGIEEEASKRRSAESIVHVATPIALYLLNHKRERLQEIELRYGMRVIIAADDSQLSPRFRIERLRAQVPGETPSFITPDLPQPLLGQPDDEGMDDDDVMVDAHEVAIAPVEETKRDVLQSGPQEGVQREAADASGAPAASDAEEQERRRRRRRRRRGRREDGQVPTGEDSEDNGDFGDATPAGMAADGPVDLDQAGARPVDLAPAEVAPRVDSNAEPAASAPQGETPVVVAPVGDVPAGGDPAGEAPVESAPMEIAPVGANPVGANPVDPAPVDSAPTEPAAARPRASRAGGRTGARKAAAKTAAAPVVTAEAEPIAVVEGEPVVDAEEGDEDGKGRRRGRRGGRRRRREGDELAPPATPGADQPDLPPVYTGPTPANPFGGQVFDIFDVMDQVEREAAARAAAPSPQPERRPNEPVPSGIGAWAQSDAPPVARPDAKPSAAAEVKPAAVPATAPVMETAAVAPAEATRSVAPEQLTPVVEAPATEAAAPSPHETATEAPSATEPVAVRADVEQPQPANDAASPEAALIKPIVIGQDVAAPVERKRGWWRRS